MLHIENRFSISNGIFIEQMLEASYIYFKLVILYNLYTKENMVSQATLYAYPMGSFIEVKSLSVLNFKLF